ncbi:RabGAP/TBC, partial [Myriangium duriaei CBS 260.36]
DRYGFKKISHHVTLEDYDAWERPYSEHLERRRVKWDALMKQFGLSTDQPTRFPPKSEKIKRYARKGIPPEWRGAAWFWYAGGPGLQKKHEGVYFNLLSKIKRGEELKDTDREHIERDLNRTFPDNLTFKPDPSPSSARTSSSDDGDSGPETPIIGALRRVLQAFAVHRPSIGYCQSLNFIAGLLLLFLDSDEEKAFLLLNVITSDYLPGTHGVSLEGANIDIAVLMTSLKELLPGVWAKLDDQPASAASNPLTLPTVSLATTPWFLTLYLTTLPVESALRIWDVLFIEGSKTLFRAALAIFKLTEPRIKAVQDPMEVFQIVQTAPRALLDVNGLMELCFRKRGQGFGGLSQDTIERRR